MSESGKKYLYDVLNIKKKRVAHSLMREALGYEIELHYVKCEK